MENHHDTWNTVQDLRVFVSNQETFVIKSCAQRSRAFNFVFCGYGYKNIPDGFYVRSAHDILRHDGKHTNNVFSNILNTPQYAQNISQFLEIGNANLSDKVFGVQLVENEAGNLTEIGNNYLHNQSMSEYKELKLKNDIPKIVQSFDLSQLQREYRLIGDVVSSALHD